MPRPFSQACENNKGHILDVISRFYRPGDMVLEIASGTAQHARHFARQMPQVVWQPTETAEGFAVLQAGLEGETLANLLPPLVLDVRRFPWPVKSAGGVFSANVLHIISQAAVEDFFRGVGQVLAPGGCLCVYGAFKYGGGFTTPSNEEFDRWLRSRDPLSGIRDFETVDALAGENGLEFIRDHDMPANNQLIVWCKAEAGPA